MNTIHSKKYVIEGNPKTITYYCSSYSRHSYEPIRSYYSPIVNYGIYYTQFEPSNGRPISACPVGPCSSGIFIEPR